MVAENNMTGKWNLYTNIESHWLGSSAPLLGPIDEALAAGNGTLVNINGATVSDTFYGDSPTAYPGVAFATQNPDRSSGLRVAYQWEDGTTHEDHPGDQVSIAGYMSTANGERFITASSVAVGGTTSATPYPLFITNKATAGPLPLYDNTVSDVLGIGLNNMGLLVKIYWHGHLLLILRSF